MQPAIGMSVSFKGLTGSTFTITQFVFVLDPVTGDIEKAFILDNLRSLFYLASRFADEFLVVLPQEGKSE